MASCSSCVTTMASPGDHVWLRERLSANARVVMFGPKITSLGSSEPRRSPTALWASARMASLSRLVANTPSWLAFVSVVTLRPVQPSSDRPSLTVIIPARNERGNIENALKRMPELGCERLEIIFVEGHSQDGTWEDKTLAEIQELLKEMSALGVAGQAETASPGDGKKRRKKPRRRGGRRGRSRNGDGNSDG